MQSISTLFLRAMKTKINSECIMRNAELVNCENTAINLSGNVGRLDHKPPKTCPYLTER